MTRIGLITTIDTNIGDDFIREGICKLLAEDIFKASEVRFVPINKHTPHMVYPPRHPMHLRNIGRLLPIVGQGVTRMVEDLCCRFDHTLFDDCDLIVQCGAPVFWPDCNENEWAVPIWQQVIGRLHDKVPVLNLAAGSCYPWERQPLCVEPAADAEYIRAILGYCRLTTVRDRLAQTLCSSLGKELQVIPCSAFLAASAGPAELGDSGYILINYMAAGGHYDWKQGIDPLEWENVVKKVIASLSRRHRIALLCHDEKELLLAQSLAPGLPVFLPKTPAEYFEVAANAKFAICNRMHASVGMAGMGIPSIAVCTDTRLLMVAELGLPAYYVKEISAQSLIEQTEQMLGAREREKERLLALRAKTREMYLAAISGVLSKG